MGNKTETERDSGQIADMLMLNGSLTECRGLVHGKMGIAVFLQNCRKYRGLTVVAGFWNNAGGTGTCHHRMVVP